MFKLIGFVTGAILVAIPTYHLLGWDDQPKQLRPSSTLKVAAAPLNQASSQRQAVIEPVSSIPADAPATGSSTGTREDVASITDSTALSPLVPGKDAIQEPLAEQSAIIPDVDTDVIQATTYTPVDNPVSDPESVLDPTQAPISTDTANDQGEQASLDIPDTSPATTGKHLHLLWSPFRTRTAADGFARRLSKVSGVDVRVAEASPGHYRVGFDYGDAGERDAYLQLIVGRTGLDLGDKPEQNEDSTSDEMDAPITVGEPDAAGSGQTR